MSVIDLSKQEVVQVLADFEEKLPNIGITLFVPDRSILRFDENSLNSEAGRMLRFMNINDYTPVVRVIDLSADHAAGKAYVGRDMDKKIFSVDIDPRILYDRDSAYATLAHELCHHYLYLFGMYRPESFDLPYYLNHGIGCDLCTIFMGFGLLVLNGYRENVGYLNLEDFCHAFCVVYHSRGMSEEHIKQIVPFSCGGYAKSIFDNMNALETIKKPDLMIARQSPDYELRRRMRILQLISKNMTDIHEKHRGFDRVFRHKQSQLNDGKHPILENLWRETMTIETYQNEKLTECCNDMDALIQKLCAATKVDLERVSEGLAWNITCPACGFVNAGSHVNSLKALKCPRCHHYFVWDGRPFDPNQRG